jgi:hypothetical protein
LFESSYQPYAFPVAENKVWSAAWAGAAIVSTVTDAVAAATATEASFEAYFMCFSLWLVAGARSAPDDGTNRCKTPLSFAGSLSAREVAAPREKVPVPGWVR